ncbi:MAG: S46 family peptidase, partial [Candidatus Marinimicrobia bacterium]|nr:S46 family peptidase [Candidatus Neomarinimicrobiota bacterium]
TTDITNGNSGSSIMNRNGELIGLAFDGNYEAMTSDWMFQPKIQRTIGVDIRYILYITEKFAGADWIIEEMMDR